MFVFSFACVFMFVIVIMGASVDNTCHELSEYWVCEASKVNNLTVLAVGPDGLDNKLASSGSDPPKGSDNYDIFLHGPLYFLP